MKIIKPDVQFIKPREVTREWFLQEYKVLEEAGRTCYKSERLITDDSAVDFVKRIVANGHEAMLEHAHMTIRFIVDRGVSHEIVRHRIASFAQESTRYCNYTKDKFGNEITVIEPCFFNDIPEGRKEVLRDVVQATLTERVQPSEHESEYCAWYDGCKTAERTYFHMLSNGATPQEARSVLPNSLKTELVMTANMREWRHFFSLRWAGTTGAPHPQMQEVAALAFVQVQNVAPELFDDILALGMVNGAKESFVDACARQTRKPAVD